MEAIETTQATEAPANFAEFKTRKAAQAAAATAPPAEEKKAPDSEEEDGKATTETAVTSETTETKTTQDDQDKDKPKREKTLEGRIKELRAAGKHKEANKLMVDAAVKTERDRAAQLEQELQTYRTRKPEERATTEPARRPAAAAPPAADDPAPKNEDYDGSAGKSYEDYLVAKAKHGFRQEQRTSEQGRQQAALKERVNTKLAVLRAKHADFDQAMSADLKAGTGFILTPQMQQFAVEHDLGFDVLYKVATTAGEHARIMALPPMMQLAELALVARELSGAPGHTATPEKPKPPVSRVPAPPPKSGGVESPAPKTTGEARNFNEFKKLKQRKA